MQQHPTLYLVPVPLSEAAVDDVLPSGVLATVKRLRYFIVENERSARRFLKSVDKTVEIDDLTFFVLNEHTDPAEIPAMLVPMEQGRDMGIISEAGCPAVADPGADVVALAQARGYEVSPLAGPSSIILSLMASGFNGQSFAFNGYLPINPQERGAKVKEMAQLVNSRRQTQIFIETPYRNNRLIAQLCRLLPHSMSLCVASDLTGERQSVVTRPLSWWSAAKYDYDKIPSIFLLYR